MMIYFKYLRYVLKHKWFVFLECCKLNVAWRGIIHDWSKFMPDEFIPYARYFYGGKASDRVKIDFDIAWLKHQKRNPHHWQFWILQNDSDGLSVLQMPQKFVREMVADWIGAGIAITGKREVQEWYIKNAEKININYWTRRRVEELIHVDDLHFQIVDCMCGVGNEAPYHPMECRIQPAWRKHPAPAEKEKP